MLPEENPPLQNHKKKEADQPKEGILPPPVIPVRKTRSGRRVKFAQKNEYHYF